MKSYYQHLSSIREFGEKENILKKPILRSSAIFPVIHNKFYSSSIHFLGYWLLKRNIPEVTLFITLRNADGNTLSRQTQIIDSAKAFSINLDEILNKIKDGKGNFLNKIAKMNKIGGLSPKNVRKFLSFIVLTRSNDC